MSKLVKFALIFILVILFSYNYCYCIDLNLTENSVETNTDGSSVVDNLPTNNPSEEISASNINSNLNYCIITFIYITSIL